MVRLRSLIVCLIVTSLFFAGCGRQVRDSGLDTEVATKADEVTPFVPDSILAAISEETELDEPGEWSVRDRALAFKPELQALQETYDLAVHHMARGDLLAAQESLDLADLALGEALSDSVIVASGLGQLYLSSLQTRLDRLQEILDEESLMHFAATLDVANDSLIALWYGGLPEIPARPLEIELNKRVDKWIAHFTGPGRGTFQKWLNRGEAFRPIVESKLRQYELPLELYYLAMIESGFNTKARSSAGAVGPWQFIRGTGRRYGLTIDYWLDERRDIVRSTESACQYLSHLFGIFQDWNLAMAGYNSGEFRVQSAVRRAGSRDFWNLKLPRQTQDYVPKMMAATWIGTHLDDFGFTITAAPEFRYEELKVDQAVDLSLLAKKGKFKRAELERLNPHLLRWCTPPDCHGYAVHVPPGKVSRLETALAQLSRDERVSFARHRVRRGETLYEIARGYGTTVKAIMQRNGIRNPRTLRAGATLVIPTHPDRTWRQPAPNGVIAAAEKVLPPLSVPGGYAKGYYTVRRGENLSLISRRLSTSVRKLQKWNGLGRATRIYPNQVLQYLYPADESNAARQQLASASSAATRRVHIVRSGESLYSISRSYGTSIQRLLSWNERISRNSILHPGDKLVLYVVQ